MPLTEICEDLMVFTSILVMISIVYFRARMGKDHLGSDQRKVKEKDEEEKEFKVLDEKDIALLKSYGQGQYTKALKVIQEFLVSPSLTSQLSRVLRRTSLTSPRESTSLRASRSLTPAWPPRLSGTWRQTSRVYSRSSLYR